MIEWLQKNFPAGKNYLVCQKNQEQINSLLMDKLVAPFHAGRKHSLWGETAKQLPSIGRKLGWVPNKMPSIFLGETVELEIADALAAQEKQYQPTIKHIETAKNLLARFNLIELAHRKPVFLSEGETKILWFLTQWVKTPEYLIIGYLPSGLSTTRIKELVDFLIEEGENSDRSFVIILGYHPDNLDWCISILSHKDWKVLPELPE